MHLQGLPEQPFLLLAPASGVGALPPCAHRPPAVDRLHGAVGGQGEWNGIRMLPTLTRLCSGPHKSVRQRAERVHQRHCPPPAANWLAGARLEWQGILLIQSLEFAAIPICLMAQSHPNPRCCSHPRACLPPSRHTVQSTNRVCFKMDCKLCRTQNQHTKSPGNTHSDRRSPSVRQSSTRL